MKFDRSNKFDFCYYGQVYSLRLKSSVLLRNGHVNEHLYFAGDDILSYILVFIRDNRKVNPNYDFGWPIQQSNVPEN